MSYAIRAVCRPDVAAGLRLSGLEPVEVATPEEGVARLGQLIRQPGVGVVLLEAGIEQRLPDTLRRELGRRPLPMVVPFPGPVWEARPGGPEGYIVELLRRVIGYRVRLR